MLTKNKGRHGLVEGVDGNSLPANCRRSLWVGSHLALNLHSRNSRSFSERRVYIEGSLFSVCCVLSCLSPAALVSRVLLPREKSVDTPDVEIPVGGIS